jgi:hypothetical protein
MAAPAAFWDDLIRSGTKSEEVIEAAGRAERVADDLAKDRGMGRIFVKGVDDIADPAARARRLQVLIRETIYFPDEAILKKINTLSPDELSSALILARGGRQIIDVVPDVAARSRLLRQGGSDLVAATGIHGPDLAREAARLDTLASVGKLPDRIGNQSIITRFSEVMRNSGNGAWKFWKEYVVPNPKKWAASGVIATYLAKPEFFHDGAGKLTEAGSREVALILGKVAEGTAKGAAEGGKQAFSGFFDTFRKQYLSGSSSFGAWLGLLLVCWVIGMLLPRTRRLFLLPLSWLFRKPNS